MAWDVSPDPLDPDGAIAYFRSRVPLTKAEWAKLQARARQQAFTVAGTAQLDLVPSAKKIRQGAFDLQNFVQANVGGSRAKLVSFVLHNRDDAITR